MPWPLKKSEPAVKYRKKGQRINEKKKSSISDDVVGFFKQKQNYSFGNKFRSHLHCHWNSGIVTLFLKTPPSVEEHDYTK